MLRIALLLAAVAFGGMGLFVAAKRRRKKTLVDRVKSSVGEGVETAGRSRQRGEKALRRRVEQIRSGKTYAFVRGHRTLPLLLVAGTAIGAGTTYALRGRIAGVIRNGNGHAEEANHYPPTSNGLKNKISRVLSISGSSLNDADLARKVRDEIFQGREYLEPRVAVSSQRAVVVLRGEVDDPEQIIELAKAARSVAGVQDVENLLHSTQEAIPEPVLVGGKSKKS